MSYYEDRETGGTNEPTLPGTGPASRAGVLAAAVNGRSCTRGVSRAQRGRNVRHGGLRERSRGRPFGGDTAVGADDHPRQRSTDHVPTLWPAQRTHRRIPRRPVPSLLVVR